MNNKIAQEQIKKYLKLEESHPIKLEEATYWLFDSDKKKIHREYGPAVIHDDGSTEWFLNGVKHRIGGPAVDYVFGQKIWYQNGVKHRADGPAQINPDGSIEYWINGSKITEEEFIKTGKP